MEHNTEMTPEFRVDTGVLDLQVRQVLPAIYQDYPDVEWQGLLTVVSVSNLTESVEIPIITHSGAAAWITNERGNTFAVVSTDIYSMSVKPKDFGVALDYTQREAAQASIGVVSIVKEKTTAGFRAMEDFLDQALLLGDESVGIRGFYRHPFMPVQASDVVFDMATDAQDMYDALAEMLAAQNEQCNGVKALYADTLYLPERVYKILTLKQMPSTINNLTVLAAFLENNQKLGQPLKVVRSNWLRQAGYGGLERIGVGRRDVAKAYIAQAPTAGPTQLNGRVYTQLMTARVAGCVVEKPLAFYWLEGTAP